MSADIASLSIEFGFCGRFVANGMKTSISLAYRLVPDLPWERRDFRSGPSLELRYALFRSSSQYLLDGSLVLLDDLNQLVQLLL